MGQRSNDFRADPKREQNPPALNLRRKKAIVSVTATAQHPADGDSPWPAVSQISNLTMRFSSLHSLGCQHTFLFPLISAGH